MRCNHPPKLHLCPSLPICSLFSFSLSCSPKSRAFQGFPFLQPEDGYKEQLKWHLTPLPFKQVCHFHQPNFTLSHFGSTIHVKANRRGFFGELLRSWSSFPVFFFLFAVVLCWIRGDSLEGEREGGWGRWLWWRGGCDSVEGRAGRRN